MARAAKAAVEHKQEVSSLNLNLSLQAGLCINLFQPYLSRAEPRYIHRKQTPPIYLSYYVMESRNLSIKLTSD